MDSHGNLFLGSSGCKSPLRRGRMEEAALFSRAAKVTQIQSVLAVLHIYFVTIFSVLIGVADEIEKSSIIFFKEG